MSERRRRHRGKKMGQLDSWQNVLDDTRDLVDDKGGCLRGDHDHDLQSVDDVGHRLAVFDLDRTLLPGSSLAILGSALCGTGILSRRQLVGHLARNLRFNKAGEREGEPDRLLSSLLALAAGHEAAPLRELVRALGEQLAASAYPSGRWLLERHLAAGDFCVVVSASPQELVEAATRALGAHRAVGTRAEVVDGCFTGRLDGPFCHGQGKLARLWVELGTSDLAGAAAYSDSASDLPLLRAAGRPVAVNPDRRLQRAARERGWPILRFT